MSSSSENGRAARKAQRARLPARERLARGRMALLVDWRKMVAPTTLAYAVLFSSMAIGGVHTTTLIALAVPVFAATWFSCQRGEGTVAVWRGWAPAGIAVALALYTLLQVVPLPMHVLAKIAPSNADVWERALSPFGTPPPTWAPISLDPGASSVEAVRWMLYAAVFVLAATISARQGAEWGIALVFVSGIAMSLVTVGHGLVGATKVFGVYEPHFAVAPWHVAPLLNPNNLAGYLNLSAMCGLALLLARRTFVPRWVAGLGVATIVGVAVTSASRGGFLVLPVGICGLAFGLWRVSRRNPADEAFSKSAVPWLLLAALAGGALLALLGGTSETWRELYDKNLEKLASLLWTRNLIREHAWFGIGRGSFESVFPAYRSVPGNVVFTHSENFPAQWCSEWGLPVGLAALGAYAWILRPRVLGATRSSLAAGATAGVLIVVLQNMMDLGLEVPAIPIALSATIGSLWGDLRRRGVTRSESSQLRARLSSSGQKWASGVAALAAAALLLVPVLGTHDIARDKEEVYFALSTLKVEDPSQLATFRNHLKAVMLRHPAEPYFPLVGALVANSSKDENPMPWLQRSLERAAVNGRAHLLVADILLQRRAVGQALLELRLAVQDDPELYGIAGQRAVQVTRDRDMLLAAVPAGPVGVPMLELFARTFTDPNDDAMRERFYREALAREPTDVGAHIALAGQLLQRLRAGPEGGCGAHLAQCEREMYEHLTVARAQSPSSSDPDAIEATWMAVNGKALEGERLLAQRCDTVPDRVTCLRARVWLAVESRRSDSFAAAAKDLLAASCASAPDCAGIAEWLGDLAGQRLEWGRASSYYARATTEAPTEGRWLKLANAAEKIGAHTETVQALEKVLQLRGGHDQALLARIEESRARAVGRLIAQ